MKLTKAMFLVLATIGVTIMVGCANDCVTCTGPTAPREYCPDDYQERSDYQSDVQAYEDAGGQCE